MVTVFMSMPVTVRMVFMVITMMILVPKAFFFSAIGMSVNFQLLFGLGDEPFKLSSIEPDTSTLLADIYGDTIPVFFFQSRFVTSRTIHAYSFLMNSPGIYV